MVRGSHILVVDDNKENLKLAGSILKENGYKIAVALNGESAIKILEKNSFDLILLDVMMPGIDGFEVCRRIKYNEKLKDIPIVFLTAKDQSKDLVDGFAAGGVDYITKPFNKDVFLARVSTHVELKQSRDMLVELNATKDKFFSIIGHDLRSPFTSIIGFSDLLVRAVKEKDYDEIQEYADVIQKSSNLSLDLLLNLIEWSRSQTGRMEFNPEHCEMVDLISKATLLYDDIARQKSITIQNVLPDNLFVVLDKAMISAVLRNLISNAIKFTMPDGKITVSTKEMQKEIIFSVEDNGVGIPRNRVDELFRIDQSYSSCGTNQEKGTGLGLIICKEFVEKHGGKIWADSEEGKGSTFYFTLPHRSVL